MSVKRNAIVYSILIILQTRKISGNAVIVVQTRKIKRNFEAN